MTGHVELVREFKITKPASFTNFVLQAATQYVIKVWHNQTVAP